MADNVKVNKIVDGARTAVFHCSNVSDGTGENNVAKVDVSALNTNGDGRACDEIALLRFCATVSNPGGNPRSLYVQWAGGATDTTVMVVPPNAFVDVDFTHFGGLTNTATGGTNDLLFTFPAATGGTMSAYDAEITVRKKYKATNE